MCVTLCQVSYVYGMHGLQYTDSSVHMECTIQSVFGILYNVFEQPIKMDQWKIDMCWILYPIFVHSHNKNTRVCVYFKEMNTKMDSYSYGKGKRSTTELIQNHAKFFC